MERRRGRGMIERGLDCGLVGLEEVLRGEGRFRRGRKPIG